MFLYFICIILSLVYHFIHTHFIYLYPRIHFDHHFIIILIPYPALSFIPVASFIPIFILFLFISYWYLCREHIGDMSSYIFKCPRFGHVRVQDLSILTYSDLGKTSYLKRLASGSLIRPRGLIKRSQLAIIFTKINVFTMFSSIIYLNPYKHMEMLDPSISCVPSISLVDVEEKVIREIRNCVRVLTRFS